jgi:hypothetical protein
MLESQSLQVLVVPGVAITFFSGLNLARYRRWRRADAVLLERRSRPGENVPEFVKLRYVANGVEVEEVAEMLEGSLGPRIGLHERVSILYDPLNPRRCTIDNLRHSQFNFLIGLAIICVSQFVSR